MNKFNEKIVLTILNLIQTMIIIFLILSSVGYNLFSDYYPFLMKINSSDVIFKVLLNIVFMSCIASFFIIHKFSGLVEKENQLKLEISKRKKLEENLYESQEIFKKAFENAATGIVFLSLEGKYSQANEAFLNMLGFTESELYKISFKDITSEDFLSMEISCLEDLANGKKKTCHMEKKYIHKNGSEVWAIVNLSLLKDTNKKPLYFIVQVQDISHLKEVEKQLRFKNKFFLNIFDCSPLLMSIEDLDTGRYIDINSSWLKYTGYEKENVVGKKLEEIKLITNNQDDLSKKILGNTDYNQKGKIIYNTKTGEKRSGILTSEIIEFENKKLLLNIIKDITETDIFTNKMARYEKLNLIGELAAGIGHEVRNPMTTVKGFLQLFKSKKELKEYEQTFNLMIEELDRANSIITEFLSIGKNKETDVKLQNLNNIIGKLKPLLQADAFENGKEVSFILKDVPDIYLNEKQIRQVILNLFRNGLEAMKENEEKGEMLICTYKKRNEVILSVKDEGPGISPEILNKIGTPFFTTKENGTGLGLAVCFGIAEAHNARIEIKNSKTGAVFKVIFMKNIT